MMYLIKDEYNTVLEYFIAESNEEAEKAKKSWQDKGLYGIEVEEVKAEDLVKASEHSFDPYDSHSNKVDLDDYNELVWRVNKLMDYCNLLELRIKHLENQC